MHLTCAEGRTLRASPIWHKGAGQGPVKAAPGCPQPCAPGPQRKALACSPEGWPGPVHSSPSLGRCWKNKGEDTCHLTLLPSGAGRWVPQGLADCSPLQVVSHNHLLQLHDIWVAKAKEQRDLAKAADGDPCNRTCLSEPALQTGPPHPSPQRAPHQSHVSQQ